MNDPTPQQTRLTLRCRKPEAEKILRALEPYEEEDAVPLLMEEIADGAWQVALYVPAEETGDWEAKLRDRLGSDLFGLELDVEPVPPIDWVAHTQASLSPVRAGRFVLHGSHDAPRFARLRRAVLIDAGQAFGTGHHGTTAGCMDIVDPLLTARAPRRVVDLGTGSGVLAIAVAKAVPAHILAADIDPVAIDVARLNARLNGVANRVRFAVADGFSHTAFRRFGPADLMIANILAGPLVSLAAGIVAATRAGGDIVLSGLLPAQAARVTAAYRARGCVLERRYERDGWTVLHLRKHRA